MRLCGQVGHDEFFGRGHDASRTDGLIRSAYKGFVNNSTDLSGELFTTLGVLTLQRMRSNGLAFNAQGPGDGGILVATDASGVASPPLASVGLARTGSARVAGNLQEIFVPDPNLAVRPIICGPKPGFGFKSHGDASA